ncbi:glycosyl transferase, family 2 [Candidatus Thiomargarita nelsonii]|uniref:Glycosyl transferase, family 2 n=1 Tax=Candidatus Thiomargarita nelsonii TaxID=1003181 RepID=A0A176RSX9_9GAMM|nr:glycosyl transferase, family 2 [Candidatus Thiomargarita nelsonii]
MPVYNGEKYIRKALDSLLAQTFTDFELIISDNASTDNTYSICQEYAQKDSRIKVFRQAENRGAEKNFAYVLYKAKGEYFMWAAYDDKCELDCIEKLVCFLESNPSIMLCTPDVRWIDNNGETIRVSHLKGIYHSSESNWKQVRKQFFEYPLSNEIFFAVYGLYRTDFLKKQEGMSPTKGIMTAIENLFLARLAIRGQIAAIPHVLKIYRTHEDSTYVRECQTLRKLDYILLGLNIRKELLRIIIGSSDITFSEKFSLLRTWILSILRAMARRLILKPLLMVIKKRL